MPLGRPLIALVTVTALAGCGTGVDRNRVRAATTAFFAAHRGAVACKQLNPSLAQAIEEKHRLPSCSRAVARVKAHRSAVAAVYVYATSARVDLANGESVFLGKTRDGWRIDAFGCRPQAGRPYDCEEES